MKHESIDTWRHAHRFIVDQGEGERKTWYVIALTASMMGVEVAGGLVFGSMALLADGWHMGTHAAAIGITAFAYRYARRHADNPVYTFGTGKVGVLGGFSSAVVLALIALWMGVESVQRLITPRAIHFNEAIAVAVVGLIVNIVSAWLLKDRHPHHHDSDHDHPESHHHHQDHNLRAAYLHVLADALTSILAIVALVTGKAFGWVWLDPIMGVVGGVIILRWSYSLIRDTGGILLDRSVEPDVGNRLRSAVEKDGDAKVADLHVWAVSSNHLGAIVSIVAKDPKHPRFYKRRLMQAHPLDHVTVEVHPFDEPTES